MLHVIGGENKKLEILSNFPSQPPANSFEFKCQVTHNDTDALYHSNQSSYFRFFMDAATEGTKQGCFKTLQGDLFAYRVQHMGCLYKDESLPGQVLTVNVWEQDIESGKLYCKITRNNKLIWLGTTSFYPMENQIASKL